VNDYPRAERRTRARISDATFDKSRNNRQTEGHGLRVVTRDPRFQWVEPGLRREILNRLNVPATFSNRVFDVVMTESAVGPITLADLDALMDGIRLVEIKVTQKLIRDEALGGFFFGATEREFALAALLGDRYLFALVVLGADNRYGDDFFVLLTLEELEARIQSKRLQYQVTLVRGITHTATKFGVGPIIPSSDG
jgi:hypothetical protein